MKRCPKSANPTLGLFNDKALYHLNEHVHSQNSRYWSAENPMLHYKVPLHDVMFGVWCATGTTTGCGRNSEAFKILVTCFSVRVSRRAGI